MADLIISIIIVSTLGIIAFFILFNYVLQKSFHIDHVESNQTPKDFGFDYEDRLIETENDKKIQIWDLNPQKMAPVIIGVHGWANTSEKLLPVAKGLEDDFRIILLNTRNHGKSDDEKYSTLITYSEDLLSAIAYAKERTEHTQPIILLGHSMGGAASIFTASKDDQVKAVVSISTFASLNDIMLKEFHNRNVPGWLIQTLLSYVEFRLGGRLTDISPVTTINKINIPVLILHGANDPVVDMECSERIEKAVQSGKIKRIVLPNHDHSSLLKDENLSKHIKKFLSSAIV
ncbi:MAG TPA: alpha/beta fold hydrolase [Calditrichaeota bacterium]|nr:alpha/beta fold hydrolase [Calditrichota bacterium]